MKCLLAAVDVVIPFYKERETLVAAIRSVLDDTNGPFVGHVYLVCDGDQEAYSWAQEHLPPIDCRITVLHTEGKEGPGPARNVGIDHSTAPYIAFLDADDLWLPHKLEQQINELNNCQCTAVCTGYRFLGGGEVRPYDSYSTLGDVALFNNIGTSTIVLSRTQLGNIRFSKRKFSQDLELWLQFVRHGGKILGLSSVTTLYRPSSRTSNKWIQLKVYGEVLRDTEFPPAQRIYCVFRQAIRGVHNHYVKRILKRIALPYRDFGKRMVDLIFCILSLPISVPIMLLTILVMTVALGESGLFVQQRVGRRGYLFPMYKVKTMRSSLGPDSGISAMEQQRIHPLGAWLRRFKLDELPQILNVIMGNMSLVGPRPDLPEVVFTVSEKERSFLELRPGITGPASLIFRDEEAMLLAAEDPFQRSMELFQEKVAINNQYMNDCSFLGDLQILFKTIFS